MARRILNKACNDLVGGAGADAMGVGPDVSKKQSVMKLQSKDVHYSNRQVVEIRQNDGRLEPKVSKQTTQTQGIKPDDKSGKPRFFNIEGDVSVDKQVERHQKPPDVPSTAYKMRSFMSSVELGHRRHHQPPTQVNQTPVKAPHPPRPRIPDPPEEVKMFLPKGIHHTDEPYIVPKFMPSYREMIMPKPKPDPLVSIVETTPPSLQKWAVEWNSEPKKTISIDELKEDLKREAAEKSELPKNQWVSSVHEQKPDETIEDRKLSEHQNDHKNQTTYAEPTEKPRAKTSDTRTTPPWCDLNVPTNYETQMGAQSPRDPDPAPRKIGQPLIDWVPPKYISTNGRQINDPKFLPYSFQEAIKNGEPLKPDQSGVPKPILPRIPQGTIYFDSEKEKFHTWFKEKMSTAVQSAVKQTSKTPGNAVSLSSTNNLPIQDAKTINKALPENSRGQNSSVQVKQGVENQTQQSSGQSRWKDENELQHQPKLKNDAITLYEPESNSSFYQWLKRRNHHVVRSEPKSLDNKKEKTPENVQNADPWNVSYTLRKRVSSPNAIFPKKRTLKNPKKSHKTVSQDDVTLRRNKRVIRTPFKSRRSVGGGDKFSKTIPTQPPKTAGKKSVTSAGAKVSANSTKKRTPKPEFSNVPTTADNLVLCDWKVGSEIDHVNNLRKMEILGNSSKATNAKKKFPAGGQMKYWETRYMRKPDMNQNQRPVPRDKEAKPNPYSWLRPKKASESKSKSVLKEVLTIEPNVVNRRSESSNFSRIDELSSFPLKLPQEVKDEVMDFSEEFNVDNFLHKEEAEEKEMLKLAQGQDNKQANEKAGDVQAKVKVKENMKFPRKVKVNTETDGLTKKVQQKVDDDDDFVLALGEDPGIEDMEWSEFIGPRNSLEHDADLTRLVCTQARQLSTMQNCCL